MRRVAPFLLGVVSLAASCLAAALAVEKKSSGFPVILVSLALLLHFVPVLNIVLSALALVSVFC